MQPQQPPVATFGLLRAQKVADVDEGDADSRGGPIRGAVRQDAHEEPGRVITPVNLSLEGGSRAKHGGDVFHDIVFDEAWGEVAKGASQNRCPER